jgi:HNH endonuclease
MIGRGKDYTGQKRGKLTFIRPTEMRGRKNAVIWELQCDCGSPPCFFAGSQVKEGVIESCGCLRFSNTEEKFWNSLDKEASNGCWKWTKVMMKSGYGTTHYQGRRVYTHRLAWELINGAIPIGMCVCHKCDNPPCCNPDHLFLGTHEENQKDKIDKGRQPKGEDTAQAILTEKDIIAIRDEYRTKGTLQRELARKYGVHIMTISDIIRRRSWRHIS